MMLHYKKRLSILASLLLGICLLLALAGCHSSEDETTGHEALTPLPGISLQTKPGETEPGSLEQTTPAVEGTTGDTTDPAEPVTQESTQPSTQAPTQTPSGSHNITFDVDPSAFASLPNDFKPWGSGGNVDGNNVPVGATWYQRDYGKYSADFVREGEGQIYLTIDEGYENGYTSVILDALKEKQVTAVFFVTMPYVKDEPDLVRRMINEGHVVGAHSVTHPAEGMPSLSLSEQLEEFKQLHEYVEQEFGYTMYLFRYPAGIFSEQSLALLQATGYRSVFWSFAYRDWVTTDQPDPTEALAKVMSCLHPGAIYLLHAVSATNAQIMGDFIDQVRAAGYTFMPYN